VTICCRLWLLLMICFEPVQVSTAFSNYRRPTTIKVATNLTRSCTLLLERGRRRNARMPTTFGGRRIYTSWGVTLFFPTCAEQNLSIWYLKYNIQLDTSDDKIFKKHKNILHFFELIRVRGNHKETHNFMLQIGFLYSFESITVLNVWR
jgi:hypothetical protein